MDNLIKDDMKKIFWLLILFFYAKVTSQEFSLLKLKPIFFESWSDKIKNIEDLKYDTDLILKYLEDHPVWNVTIIGQSSAEIEQKHINDSFIVSLRRANNVANRLAFAGVPTDRIKILAISDQNAKIDPKEGSEFQNSDKRADIYITI